LLDVAGSTPLARSREREEAPRFEPSFQRGRSSIEQGVLPSLMTRVSRRR